MAQNIYNPTTGAKGYQVPGGTLSPGWQYMSGGSAPVLPTVATAPATPAPNTPAVPALNQSFNGTNYNLSDPASQKSYMAAINAVPADSSTTSASPTATDDLTLKGLLQRFSTDSALPAGYTDLQDKMAQLEAGRNASYKQLETEGIATPFTSGYEAAINRDVTGKEGVANTEMTNMLNNRSTLLSSDQVMMEALKPTSVGLGTNLVNPVTGETVAEGQSYSGKLGASNVLSLSKTYPDAGILPTDTPDVAAQKASQAASFVAKYGKASYQWNPNTGQFELLTTNRLGTTTPGGGTGTGGSSISSGGTTNFGGSGITQGANNDAVKSLQNFLISQGYNIPAGATGYYGDQTAQAVAAFQKANGVDTSGGGVGTFGPKTQAAANGKGFSLNGTMTSSPQTNTSSSSTSTSPFGLSLANKIDAATLTYMQTGEMPSGIYPADQDKVRQRALAVNPNFNPTIAKANAKAIGEQVSQQADTSRAITAADSNFNLLTATFGKSGINNQESPLANEINNKIKLGLLGDSDLASFTSAVSTLQTEYAMVLGRGGEVTDSVRNSAQKVISGNYSMKDLIALHDYIDKEGKNVINSYDQTIKSLTSGTGGSSNFGTGGSTNGINSTSQSILDKYGIK